MTVSTVPGRISSASIQIRDNASRSVSPALAPSHRGDSRRRRHGESDLLQRLTGRQREVLGLVAEGLSNSAIARLLFISERAVVGHISRIYDQLDIPLSNDDHRRVRAVLRYIAD